MTWRRRAFGPARCLTASCRTCEYFYDPPPRDVLETALHLLPRRPASELRRLLEPIDRRILHRTLPDPFAPPGPWWSRRLRQSLLD